MPLVAILLMQDSDLKRQAAVLGPVASHCGSAVIAGRTLRAQIDTVWRVATEEVAEDVDGLTTPVRPALAEEYNFDPFLYLIEHTGRICGLQGGLDLLKRIVGLRWCRPADQKHSG